MRFQQLQLNIDSIQSQHLEFSTTPMPRITVTGASSLIGYFLLPKLVESHENIRAISRNPAASQENVPHLTWEQADIYHAPDILQSDETLISLTPIWVLADFLEKSAVAPSRVVAFSSTSAVTKKDSSIPKERELAAKLYDGEQRLMAYCREHQCRWTILRPTLVYGAGKDKNVSAIARMIKRFGFFPVLGKATGLRSPVHAEDLAQAVISCLENSGTANKSYQLTGGDDISYNEMLRRIFIGLGRKPRMVKSPEFVARLGINFARQFPQFSDLTPELINRSAQDLVFDHQRAVEDFGYTSRSFHPREEDLITRSSGKGRG